MFGFLKKNKAPLPIFEALGTDMHNHLVPCVDDGSKGYEETIECITIMKNLGYKKMFITPHFQFPRFPNSEEDISSKYEQLKEVLRNRGVDIELCGIGGEYRIDSGFRPRMEQGINFLKIDDKYLLIELSLHQQMLGIVDLVFDLQMRGYEIILAHPERYPYYGSQSEILQKLKEQGVYFQLNILSLNGFYGEHAQKKAFDYLENDWVEFLGTDMHNVMYAKALEDASRSPKIKKILETHTFLNNEL